MIQRSENGDGAAGLADREPAVPARGDILEEPSPTRLADEGSFSSSEGLGSGAPSVTRGADRKDGLGPRVVAGIDWLRMVGPVETFPEVMDALDELHGGTTGTAKPIKGLWSFEYGFQVESGAKWFKSRPGTRLGHRAAVEMPGGVTGAFHEDDLRWFIARCYAAGWRASRIDLYLDLLAFFGAGFIVAILAACARLELALLRRWQEICPRTADGELIGRTVYLGSRAGGRFIRVYDKGLQTGTGEPDQWVRWETEFSGNYADLIARRLMAEGDVTELALGAVDFREGDRSQRLSARPRAPWWSEWVERIGRGLEPVKAARDRSTSVERHAGWLRRSVVPFLRLAAWRTGVDERELWDYIAAGVPPAESDARRSTLAAEYAQEYHEGRSWTQ